MPTRAQDLRKLEGVDDLLATVNERQNSKASKIGEYLIKAKDQLARAQKVFGVAQDAVNASPATKNLADELFAPAKAVMSLLEAVADVHPAIKVVVVVVKGIVDLHTAAKKNDDQIAAVFFTMNSLLYVLSELNPVFDQDEFKDELQTMWVGIKGSVGDFGNFCKVYYKENQFKKYLKCGSYKDKLADFVQTFSDHQQNLRDMLQGQSALKLIDVQVNVRKITTYITTLNEKERVAQEFLEKYGDAEILIKARIIKKLDLLALKAVKKLSEKLKESVNISELRIAMRIDLEKALENSSREYVLQVKHATLTLQASMEGHTQAILRKLNAGPHEHIEDLHIQAVWQEMGSKWSAKTRLFLDAVNAHFTQEFLEYQQKQGQPHEDSWTLYFLSKVIFYPAIAEGIDEDSSGFVSVHEVNDFLQSRPQGWSVARWIAFWSVGPFFTDMEHQDKIQNMLDDLEHLSGQVKSENMKRVKYFCGVIKRLRLIRVYGSIDAYVAADTGDSEKAYEALEKLRKQWRTQQMERVKKNLDDTQYTISDPEVVGLVVGQGRIEQSVMCLISLLLQHHIKIIRLAKTYIISVDEFLTMRRTWDNFFEAIDNRMRTLSEVWRQQRLDVSNQISTYAGGMLQAWYERKEADDDTSDDEDDGSEYEETDYSYDDDDDDDDAGEDEDNSGEQHEVPEEAASEQKGEELTTDILLYPIPAEPDDDYGLDTEDEDDWTNRANLKKKAEAVVAGRLDKIEGRLESLEGLLRQLLSVNGINVGNVPSNSTGLAHSVGDQESPDGEPVGQQESSPPSPLRSSPGSPIASVPGSPPAPVPSSPDRSAPPSPGSSAPPSPSYSAPASPARSASPSPFGSAPPSPTGSNQVSPFGSAPPSPAGSTSYYD